jgi:hypothetical protein
MHLIDRMLGKLSDRWRGAIILDGIPLAGSPGSGDKNRKYDIAPDVPDRPV